MAYKIKVYGREVVCETPDEVFALIRAAAARELAREPTGEPSPLDDKPRDTSAVTRESRS